MEQKEEREFVLPPPMGLYDAREEKDSCGVGVVLSVLGPVGATHTIVRDGLDILRRLKHRGACGCEEQTGDGAGIILSLPHLFFRRVLKQDQGIELPPPGKYAAGIVFLDRDFAKRQRAKSHIEVRWFVGLHALRFPFLPPPHLGSILFCFNLLVKAVIARYGENQVSFLAWRPVPVNNEQLGKSAKVLVNNT